MKALILSCNTGQGHNSCASAIEEYIISQGDEAECADALSFISNDISSLISRGHVFIYRHMPWLFKKGYGFSERHEEVFEPGSPVWKLMSRGIDSLYSYIEEKGFDTVISPHIFPAMMLTEMNKKYRSGIKTAFVTTDYTFPPGAVEGDMDLFFVAGDEEKLPLPPEKVRHCPVPVRGEFYQRLERKEAKRRLGLPEDKKHLLVMCGSMGCGPMKRICYELERNTDDDTVITVICGTNKRLKFWLDTMLGRKSRFHILGYTRDMSLMMDSAELYLTKPGGISTSEAAVKALPMVLLDTVSGCEGYNLRYMTERGLALTAKGPEKLAKLCAELLNDEEKLESMRCCAEKINKENPAEIIYREMSGK